MNDPFEPYNEMDIKKKKKKVQLDLGPWPRIYITNPCAICPQKI